MVHQLVSFKIDNEEYAVDILSVQEINRMGQITKIPRSGENIEGVINLRGKVIPVVNLRRKFGLPETGNGIDGRIMVVDVNGLIMGIIVDAVSEVLRVPEETIEPPPQIASGINTDFIRGVGKLETRLVILIDLNRLIDTEKIKTAVC